MRRTSTTSNALLGLLALRPSWSTWELAQQMGRNLRYFWPRAESRVYDELRRLDAAGLVRADRGRVGRRPRTTYEITAAGRRHLERWLAAEPRATYLESEALLRVLLGRLAGEVELRTAVAQVRADADAIIAVSQDVADEYMSGTAPFQDHVRVRALVFDYLRRHATAMSEWADAAEAHLDAIQGASDADADAAGVELIARSHKSLAASLALRRSPLP